MKKTLEMQTKLKDILHKTCANIINAFDRFHLPYMWKSALEISLRNAQYDLKEEVLVKGCGWKANNILM